MESDGFYNDRPTQGAKSKKKGTSHIDARSMIEGI